MQKEIIIIMGYNAAGKSTLTEFYIKQGYTHFNRDILGGSLDDLSDKVRQYLHLSGNKQVVIDNTYPSVKSRVSIIKVAKDNKIPIRCIHLTTSFEDAQLNACLRMIKKTGKLLQPEDFKETKDPNLFPPVALFAYRKEFQEPTLKEGFISIVKVPFVRTWDPKYKNKAILVDYDGTLRLSTGEQKYPINIKDIQMLPGRTEVLKRYESQGYIILGVSNQSGIAKGTPKEKVVACFEETNKNLGIDIDYQFCPHRIPPVSCYCRKPHPGLGAYFIEKYKLDPSKCIMVGDMTSDKTFAERCGFTYTDQKDFFGQ